MWCDFGAVCLWWWAPVIFLAPWRALALQGGHLSSSESTDRIRVDSKPKMKKIDLDGALPWLGFGRGVRVVGGGDFGRFLAFLALLRAWAVCRVPIFIAVSLRTVSGLI